MSIVVNWGYKINHLLRSYHVYLVAVVVILSLLPFRWIPSGMLLNSEDTRLPNYESLYFQSSYAWGQTLAYGNPATAVDKGLYTPLSQLYRFLQYLGADNSLSLKIYFSLSIALIVVSFYFFSTIFTNKFRVFLPSLLAYLFSFYTISSIFQYPAKNVQMYLMPALFYCTYYYLKTNSKLYLCLNFIVVFIGQVIFSNVPQAIITFSAYPLGLIFYIITNQSNNIKRSLGHFVILIVTILPIVLMHGAIYYFSTIQNLKGVRQVNSFTATAGNLRMVPQFRGAWWEYSDYEGIPYSIWTEFYDSPILVIASYLVTGAVIFLFITRQSLNVVKTFWLILYLLAFLLTSGIALVPHLYEYMMLKIPFFIMFREPWAKFIPLLLFSFCALLLYALDSLILSKRKDLLLYIFITLTVLIKCYPFFSDNLYGFNIGWRQIFSKPPAYWWEYKKWTQGLDDKVILPVPFPLRHETFEWRYNWYPEGDGNTNIYLPIPFTAVNIFTPSALYKSADIVEYFLQKGSFDFIKLGRVDYVLVQKDIVFISNFSSSDRQYRSIDQYLNLESAIAFDSKLKVYSVKDEYKLDHIYVPNSVQSIIDDSPEFLFNLVTSRNYLPKTMFVTDEIPKNLDTNQGISIQVTRVNPTKYLVILNNARGVVPLMFSETYNKFWNLRPQGGSALNDFRSYEIGNHVETNGFANGWFLDAEKTCSASNHCSKNSDGSFNMRLEVVYYPQTYFYAIYLVLAVSLCLAVVGVIIYALKPIIGRR